jgi:hypothetical protein
MLSSRALRKRGSRRRGGSSAPAYRANLRRLGFTDEDLVPGGSDRLIDAVTAGGSRRRRRRIQEHLDAGADHVTLHVLDSDPQNGSIKGMACRDGSGASRLHYCPALSELSTTHPFPAPATWPAGPLPTASPHP